MTQLKQVIKRSGAVVDFNPDRITNAIYRAAVSVGGRDRDLAEQLAGHVIAYLEDTLPEGGLPHVEEVQDAVEKILIERGHAKVAKEYILYREQRARRRNERADQTLRPSENIPWAKLWYALDWAVANGVHTIQGLNQRLARGEFNDLVDDTERAYHDEIKTAVEAIYARRGELKLVIISGPSSSGKTTTTIKVGERLRARGMRLVTLNVDHYFFDLALHPKDEFGDYDFETPQALDLSLVNQHLQRLVAGEEVRIPYYDFKTGRRYEERTPMRLQPQDVILIDSLHGLYPAMTASLPDEQKFKLYLEPLLQMKDEAGKYIRWTDLRLIRRMLRDAVHRAYDPRRTLEHWHYVRASELRHIIPNLNQTDTIINTSLPYELPIYAGRMLADFKRWVADYHADPLRQDAYQRAERVYHLLQQVTPVVDDSPVPGDSILREFIGGSIYDAA